MTDAEILELVMRMRAAQKAFFAARREGRQDVRALNASRELEREVDKALAARFSPQRSLL